MRVFFIFNHQNFFINFKKLGSNSLFNYILIILYIITGSIPNIGAIDILAPQWIYLGAINLITCLYLLSSRGNYLNNHLQSLFSTYFIYIYIFYFLWNAFSYFYAVNSVETIINLPRVGNTFFAIVFCFFLISEIPNKINFVTSVFFFFLLAEMISYYYDLSIIYPKEGLRVIQIKGFAGNKNITAASIAFKIPFAIYFLLNSKYRIFKAIAFIITFAGLFAVSLIQARAAILSSMIVLSILVLFLIYKALADQKFRKVKLLSYSFLIISPYLLSFVFNLIATSSANNKYRKVDITDTIGTISFSEESSNGRFNYWHDAWEYIKENPLFASGLGNWKIESIEKGKEHISGYTVPYHAHNDFIHVFAETGILGGSAYLLIFIFITYYIFQINFKEYRLSGFLNLKYFILALPLIVYGIDALLNFPVARPLMQSSLAIYLGLILSIYLAKSSEQENKFKRSFIAKSFFSIMLLLIIPGIVVHVISYISLRQQGRLLYEFNNAKYTYTRAELDQISHTFPNLTETAMPIKAMKARYYYLSGNKEEAHKMALEGNNDNPKIHFGNNLKAQFLLQENKIDSAYVYARKAFYGIPNNMPHYDIYMRVLVFKKEFNEINNAFQMVNKMAGDTKSSWTIYLRSLALTRSLGDSFAMAKAQEAYNKYPKDESIFQLYRILTYGQARMTEAENIAKSAAEFFEKSDFIKSAEEYSTALDKDPLQLTYAINAGLSYYRATNYESSIKYFKLAKSSKDLTVVEKASRFLGLSLYNLGDNKAACAEFINLLTRFPKRMYQQEFNKYCR